MPSIPSPAARPDWLDEGYWGESGVKLDALKPVLDEHKALTAAQAERARAIPEKPDGYKLELPQGAVPEGATFEFDEQSPLLQNARKVAHEMGLPQAEFSRLLGLYAQDKIAEDAKLQADIAAEKPKLGANANARIDAVKTFLATAPKHIAEQAQANLFAAWQVEAWEWAASKISSQGGAGLPGGGRDVPGKAAEPSDEEYAAMSTTQKMDYARRAAAGKR